METVNIHAAKTNLSKLIARVEAGEEIMIARDGKPVIKLVAVSAPGKKRMPGGRFEGLLPLGPAFWEPLPEDELKGWGQI